MKALDRLDVEAKEFGYYGHAALEELNDNRNSGIDLLVREAIQNSADAAPQRKGLARIEFEYKDFSVASLKNILDSKTLRRWGDLGKPIEGVSLAIRDYGDGLSGPASFSEVKKDNHNRPLESLGNFIKLTKTIGQAQDRQKAGGAFGVGKTIFYRISELPVMFYSRFKGEDERYHERLLFCMIEDEQSWSQNGAQEDDRTLLQNATGFAWWGKVRGSEILPIEDDHRITQILEQTGVKHYTANQTGTTIFMPFVRNGQLPTNPDADDGGAPSNPPWLSGTSDFKEKLSKFTRFAIQRWYAPRIGESDYPHGPGLDVFVNHKRVSVDKPLFLLVKDLYWYLHGRPCDERTKKLDISTKRILLNSSDAGVLSIIKIPNGDPMLRMRDDGGDYPAPEVQATDYPRGMRRPIIALVRSPGMIVSFQCDGDPWVNGIEEDADNKVIGVFVLNSAAILKDKFAPSNNASSKLLLEDYVRFNEGHAHNRWEEERGLKNAECPDLFRKLISTVSRKINNEFYSKEIDDSDRGGAELVSAELAKLLLPEGFGTGIDGRGRGEGKGGRGGGNLRTKRGDSPALEVNSTDFEKGNALVVGFTLNTGSAKSFHVSLSADSESGAISLDSWQNSISDTPFPFCIDALETTTIKIAGNKGNSAKFEKIINKANRVFSNDSIKLELLDQARIKFSSLKLQKMDPRCIEGKIRITVSDRTFLPMIHINSIEGFEIENKSADSKVA
jgi:hypothetical protein